MFALTELPTSLAVIGAGPIGCELAQSFARFGTRVTLFDIEDHVLPREDADAAAVVQDALEADGVELQLGAAISAVQERGAAKALRFTAAGQEQEIEVASILVSVGRKPNVDGLGLEAAGVEFDPRRGIDVDDRLRTSNRRVYACGDVASAYQFTHTADAQARIVLQNALFFGRARNSRLVVPWCTYTSPEIAHVGLYAEAAREKGHDVETLTIPMADVDRARLEGRTEGFLRVHHEKGKVLGATIVAEHAGDMIGEMAVAITHGVSLGQLSATIHPYPTQAEVIRKAGDAYRRGSLTPLVKRLFAFWFRLFR